ncbi:hypothetical protein ACLOJK_031312 [Asimina triloba]
MRAFIEVIAALFIPRCMMDLLIVQGVLLEQALLHFEHFTFQPFLAWTLSWMIWDDLCARHEMERTSSSHLFPTGELHLSLTRSLLSRPIWEEVFIGSFLAYGMLGFVLLLPLKLGSRLEWAILLLLYVTAANSAELDAVWRWVYIDVEEDDIYAG